jgi:hypothetical protein
MNIKILVATHKNYQMPDDSIYLPIFVGNEIHINNTNFQPDNIGDNISVLNPYYNELTAQYWAWKNLKSADVIGLVHYRRYFSLNKKRGLENILNEIQITELLSEAPVILPKKRKYYIESNYSHYVHAHKSEPLEKTRELITNKYPEYLPALENVFKRTSGHYFNMFIMKKAYFDEYSNWLFKILNDIYKQIDFSDYDDYEKRSMGFVSELLLDTWIEANNIKYKEVPFVFEEKQNWLKKGSLFIYRKLQGNKK